MLKQLLNGNNGLLLILALNKTDLSPLSVSATVKKCDCIFFSQNQSTEFQNKFQRAFLKFSKVNELKK